jgi:hypothetical protein
MVFNQPGLTGIYVAVPFSMGVVFLLVFSLGVRVSDLLQVVSRMNTEDIHSQNADGK